jgi:elongation factor 3
MIVAKSGSTSTQTTPAQSDISAFLDTIFNAKSSQESLDASYGLVNVLLDSTGYRGLIQYGILEEIRKAAADKKSGIKRESAMILLGAILEKMPPKQPLAEVVFLIQDKKPLTAAFDALADKGSVVRESAQFALDSLFSLLSPEAMVVSLLPFLCEYLSRGSGKWQGAVGAYALMAKIAEKSKPGMGTKDEEKEKEILRESMGRKLDTLIPIVESGMHDLKNEVSRQAVKTMTSLTTLLSNDDVAPRIPLLVKAMENPSASALQEAIHALSQTTFVAIVTSPVLALLTPLLERSLNTPTTPQEVLRQTVVVVENLTKLVHDPIEARAFLPKLQPGVKGVESRASLPEVRAIAKNALIVMAKAMGDDGTAHGLITKMTSAEVVAILSKELTSFGCTVPSSEETIWKSTKAYVSDLICVDMICREAKRAVKTATPYLENILLPAEKISELASSLEAELVKADQARYGSTKVEEDPNEVEIVDADFSLAYGGMLLLTQTKLRLLKGHRYGLCGRNGAGKSTLMRSIASGKLEGFPDQDTLKTCFVEHNQGEDADLSILQFVSKDPNIAKQGQEKISEVLAEFGFTSGEDGRQQQKVGSLSGGWKMKLALARAMLLGADVLLLDEPTNHLDVANVKWLQEYLKSHSEITSLIVSHDSGFLDEVCTDIYHYESKKLVHYRGNLAAFVKVKPEGKSYYTLSASQVQFKFPPPGILTGVKSTTRSIVRMSNVTYTYPGASKPSLYNASCSLSLSSRVAIIGANGAGKSTLIKLLTGEHIAQEGKVEKHPNLRIGYIKQHALEHVEMHMEKTPNQYLQWRYANGDDREVLLKQTRVLTDEDREQLDKWVDLGDGNGKRKVEALIGRAKYKKSFQYEV